MKPKIAFFCTIIIGNIFSQPTLTGHLTDWNNNPIPYAQVTLVNAKLTCQSDLIGYFDFQTATANRHNSSPSRAPFSSTSTPHLTKNLLTIPIVKPYERVRISIYSIDGREIESLFSGDLPQGTHEIFIVKRSTGLFSTTNSHRSSHRLNSTGSQWAV